jgi:hypothetical protein
VLFNITTNFLQPLLVDLLVFHLHIVFLFRLRNFLHHIWKNKQKKIFACIQDFEALKTKCIVGSVWFEILSKFGSDLSCMVAWCLRGCIVKFTKKNISFPPIDRIH